MVDYAREDRRIVLRMYQRRLRRKLLYPAIGLIGIGLGVLWAQAMIHGWL